MITIVIPSFNDAQDLPIQIASIIRQGPLISRIIVVNDGSTDDTEDVLAKIKFNEPRLMTKTLTKNVGYLHAAHIGLSYVETDFFTIASANDFLMPGWAEKSLNAIQAIPDIGLCLSRMYVINEISKDITKTVFPKRLSGAILSPLEFHRSVMQYGFWFSSSTMLIRRSNYNEKFVDFASASVFADGLTICMLGLKAGVVVLDEPVGVFFESGDSISGTTSAPSVGVKIIQEVSNTLKMSPYVELVDRQLARRILKQLTYTYIMEATSELTSKYLQLAESTLPPMASRALRTSLRFMFFFFRLLAFACLRPLDLFAIRSSSHMVNLNEKRTVCEYRKTLSDSLSSMGVDS